MLSEGIAPSRAVPEPPCPDRPGIEPVLVSGIRLRAAAVPFVGAVVPVPSTAPGILSILPPIPGPALHAAPWSGLALPADAAPSVESAGPVPSTAHPFRSATDSDGP